MTNKWNAKWNIIKLVRWFTKKKFHVLNIGHQFKNKNTFVWSNGRLVNGFVNRPFSPWQTPFSMPWPRANKSQVNEPLDTISLPRLPFKIATDLILKLKIKGPTTSTIHFQFLSLERDFRYLWPFLNILLVGV